MGGCDFSRAAVQVEPTLVKMAHLDRIEAIDLLDEPVADGSADEKKRMRREAKKRIAAASAELTQIGKRAQMLDFVRLDVEQNHIRAFEPHLGRLNEENSHRGGVCIDFRPIEDLVVQGNRERAETELARSLEELMRGVIEMIFRIVERVDMEIDLDPIALRAPARCFLPSLRDPKCSFRTSLGVNRAREDFEDEEEDENDCPVGGGCSCFLAFLIQFSRTRSGGEMADTYV